MLVLKRLELFNWKSHENTTLDFTKGVNLLIGIMGAGKSSILEAISYALFGTFYGLEKKKIRLSDVIRNGFERSKVILYFDWKGSTYKVIRTIESNKSSAELFKDNKLIEKGQTNVNKYVSSLLSLDYSLFNRAIYAEQNNIDSILSLPPSKRKESFDMVLGLDKFDTAKKNLTRIINRFKSNLKLLVRSYDEQKISELKEQIKQLEEQKQQKQQLLSKKDHELKSITSELLTYKGDLTKYRSLLSSLEQKISELHVLEGRIATLKKDIAEFNEQQIEEIRKKIDEIDINNIKQEIKELENNKNVVSNTLSNIEFQLKTIEEKKQRILSLKERYVPVERLKEDLEQIKQKREKLLLKKSIAKNRIKELNSLIEHLSNASSTCPLCKRPLTEEHRTSLISSFENERKELEDVLSLPIPDITLYEKRYLQNLKIKQQIDDLELGLKDSNELLEKRKDLKEQLDAINKELSQKNERYMALSKNLERLKMELNNLLSLKRKKELLLSYQQRVSSLPELLNKKEEIKEYLSDAQAKYSSASSKKEALVDIIEELKAHLSNIENTLQTSKYSLDKLLEQKENINKFSYVIDALEKYKLALEKTQIEIRENTIDAINHSLNNVWNLLYPYSDFKEVKLSSKDYSFEVKKSSWEKIEKMSGGERTALALAIRIVLASVLAGHINLLFLDEPTHNLDQRSITLLSDLIQNSLSELINQSIIITHDETFIGEDFSTTYLLYRDKDKDAPTEYKKI